MAELKFTHEQLLQKIRREALCADYWIEGFRTNKDAGSLRCAAFAIGRVAGALNVLMLDQPELSEEMESIRQRMADAYDNLDVAITRQ